MTTALQLFADLGAAALVAAVWGRWHMVTGSALARARRGHRLLVAAAPRP